METQKAIEIKKAIFTLSDYLEIQPQELVSSICFLNKERFSKLKEASQVWNAFDEADIVTRGKMLGIDIIVS